MKKCFFFFFLLPILALAQEYPYTLAERGYTETAGTRREISPNSPIKSQDGIGLCYGFSATSLLEHYRCKELKLDCNNLNEQLSSIDVTSHYRRKALVEGGDTFAIFSNIENGKDVKIAREECVKFSNLVYQVNVSSSSYIKDEKNGWNFLIKKWNEYKGPGKDNTRNDCVNCLVESIQKELTNLPTPAEQLKDAFYTARSLEDFLYKSILPAKCLDPSKMATIPKFKSNNFPTYKETLSAENLSKKIQSLLLSDVPVEMAICTQPAGDGKCAEGNGHSIALFGIKEVCRGSDCKVMVQVKNSYGMSWQNQNDNGWLDLNTLVASSLIMTQYRNISWIEKPGFVLTEKTLRNYSKPTPSTSTPSSSSGNGAGIPSQYKDHKGIWKCPGAKYVQHFEEGCVPYKP